MKDQKRALRITLLLALGLFGGLVFYTSYDHSDLSPRHAQDHVRYGLDVEVKWIAEADQASREVIQDTFSFYAERLALYTGAQSSRFQLDDLSGMYQLTASLDFGSPATGQRLLSLLIDHGFVDPGAYHYQHGMGHGALALHLPVPQTGHVLHLDGSVFELTVAPRADFDWLETEVG
jgi:hypothetical protein